MKDKPITKGETMNQKLIHDLREDLHKAQQAHIDCMDRYGNIPAYRRYEAQTAIQKAKEIKQSIDYIYNMHKEI